MRQQHQVSWSEEEVARIRHQVAEAVPIEDGTGWSLGCDPAFLAEFRDHWLHRYDPARALAQVNRHPHFLADVGEQRVHYVHILGEGERRRPLLLTHGWPGSYLEFWRVADALAFPSRLGLGTEHAFDLVIPSLPGHAHSPRPAAPLGHKSTADLWNRLMTEVLGYDSYLAQGGDWGSLVTAQLGMRHPETVRGIHLNGLGLRPQRPLDAAEQQWHQRLLVARAEFGGYAAVQASRPASLALLGRGNPLGQAAWILERFHDWADLRDGRTLETVFGLDDLITNVMLYVVGDAFATSLRFYTGFAREGGIEVPAGTRCPVPTGYAAFGADPSLPAPPRSLVERLFSLVHWSSPEIGGHFAALEQPDVFAADVRAWARQVWP